MLNENNRIEKHANVICNGDNVNVEKVAIFDYKKLTDYSINLLLHMAKLSVSGVMFMWQSDKSKYIK